MGEDIKFNYSDHTPMTPTRFPLKLHLGVIDVTLLTGTFLFYFRQHHEVHQDAIILNGNLKRFMFHFFRYFQTTQFSDGLYIVFKKIKIFIGPVNHEKIPRVQVGGPLYPRSV